MPQPARPQLWVIAGPNGAGKSTLVRQKLAALLFVINPDDIALALPRRADGTLNELEAGRHAIALRKSKIANGLSFAIETTMSGSSTLRFMATARASGYKVTLIYIGLDDARLSQSRVATRVSDGGHDVPTTAVERRYQTTMEKLGDALALAERGYVFDNSGTRRHLLLTREGSRTKYLAPELPNWAIAAIPEPLRMAMSPK